MPKGYEEAKRKSKTVGLVPGEGGGLTISQAQKAAMADSGGRGEGSVVPKATPMGTGFGGHAERKADKDK